MRHFTLLHIFSFHFQIRYLINLYFSTTQNFQITYFLPVIQMVTKPDCQTIVGVLNNGWCSQQWLVSSTMVGVLNNDWCPQQWLVFSFLRRFCRMWYSIVCGHAHFQHQSHNLCFTISVQRPD